MPLLLNFFNEVTPPLQNYCLLTPELQWQSRGKSAAYLTAGVGTRSLARSLSTSLGARLAAPRRSGAVRSRGKSRMA